MCKSAVFERRQINEKKVIENPRISSEQFTTDELEKKAEAKVRQKKGGKD